MTEKASKLRQIYHISTPWDRLEGSWGEGGGTMAALEIPGIRGREAAGMERVVLTGALKKSSFFQKLLL